MKTATYTQIYLHLVFSPKGRQSLISENIQEILYSYLSETINNKKHKTYIINGMPDHGKSQIQTVSDYIKNQKIHHNKMKFKEEYIGLLDRFGIDYDEKFIFESYD